MILVVGATGLVGREVCRQLVKAGTPVRALVRTGSDPDTVAALRMMGTEPVEGDVRDRSSLDRAVRGVDGIVCTISSMPFRYEPGVNDIVTVDTEGVRHLVDAAVAARVPKFVYTSFSGHMERRFPLRDAKRTVEGWLKASPLDWTILRPSYFMEGWLSPMVGFDPAQGTATIYGTGEHPISWISRQDVASFAVASLTHPSAHKAVLELGGPQPLTPLEVVRIFESVFGRTIDLTFVPVEALDAQLAAATDPMQQSFMALMRCYADGDPIEMGATARLLPDRLTTVDAYAVSIRPAVATS